MIYLIFYYVPDHINYYEIFFVIDRERASRERFNFKIVMLYLEHTVNALDTTLKPSIKQCQVSLSYLSLSVHA